MSTRRYSRLAQSIGAWLVGQCEDGRPRLIGDELLDAFPHHGRSDVALALAELEDDGLVTLGRSIGPALPHTRPTYRLFALADPAVTGQSPKRDAVDLARRMLNDPANASVRILFEVTGWPHRRFNPALGLLLPSFGEGRYSKSMPSDFPTNSVILGPHEQLALRRFIEDNAR